MPVCVPIKDMRNTVAFASLVEESDEPVIVTKNGYDQFVVLRSKDYDALAKAEARARIMERMLVAERERNEGNARDAFDMTAELRERHGL